jgi:hypothetical protein
MVAGGSGAAALQATAPTYRSADALGIAVGTRGCGLTAVPTPTQPGISHFKNVQCNYASALDLQIAGAFQPGVVVLTLEPQDVAARWTGKRSVATGSPEWSRAADAQLDHFRAQLPASTRRLVIVEGCMSIATTGTSASVPSFSQARTTWRVYAQSHAGRVEFRQMPTAACRTTDRASAARAWSSLVQPT